MDEEIKQLEIDAQWWYRNDNLYKQEECIDKMYLLKEKKYRANFDARVFNLPIHEVVNNLIWRQQDAIRNSVSSLAQSLFTHKELQGVNSKDMKEKMEAEREVKWEDLPTDFQRGAAALKDSEGKWFIDINIPIFTENRKYIEDLININQYK